MSHGTIYQRTKKNVNRLKKSKDIQLSDTKYLSERCALCKIQGHELSPSSIYCTDCRMDILAGKKKSVLLEMFDKDL